MNKKGLPQDTVTITSDPVRFGRHLFLDAGRKLVAHAAAVSRSWPAGFRSRFRLAQVPAQGVKPTGGALLSPLRLFSPVQVGARFHQG